MNYESALRQLARTNHWQSLYHASKDLNIQLFDNDKNFSGLQVQFLHWLNVYSLLYEELSKHEDDYLTEAVIDSEFRTNCYLIYRNKKCDFMWKKHRQEEKTAELKTRNPKAFSSEGKQQMMEVEFRREK